MVLSWLFKASEVEKPVNNENVEKKINGNVEKKIKRELYNSFRQKGISVSNLNVNIDTGNVNVYLMLKS